MPPVPVVDPENLLELFGGGPRLVCVFGRSIVWGRAGFAMLGRHWRRHDEHDLARGVRDQLLDERAARGRGELAQTGVNDERLAVIKGCERKGLEDAGVAAGAGRGNAKAVGHEEPFHGKGIQPDGFEAFCVSRLRRP